MCNRHTQQLTQAPFRSYEELLEVIACAALAQLHITHTFQLITARNTRATCEVHTTVTHQSHNQLTKAPLGPDEQLFQVVACVVLAQLPQQVQHSAIWQHHLQPQYSPMQRAVPQQPQTACMATAQHETARQKYCTIIRDRVQSSVLKLSLGADIEPQQQTRSF